MSTQRYIDTSFWDDSWVQELDPSEKLLYIYLLTNPLTNIAGVMELTIKRICFDTGFNSDTVGHILGKFEAAKKVYRYKNYIIIRNFPKHQQIENEKILKGIASILSKLPDDILCYLEQIEYQLNIRETFDSLCIPYTYPTNYLNLKEFNTNLNLNTDKIDDKVCNNVTSMSQIGNTDTDKELDKDKGSKNIKNVPTNVGNKGRKSNSFAYSVFTNHHFKIYEELRAKHIINDKPVNYNYGLIGKRVKALLSNPYFSEENILQGITNAKNDSSCLKNNFSLEQMLTEANMTRLIEERYISLSKTNNQNNFGNSKYQQVYTDEEYRAWSDDPADIPF